MQVYVNGHLASVAHFRETVGFVPQDDNVFSNLTVRENLYYSASLRLPIGKSRREVNDVVDKVIGSLGAFKFLPQWAFKGCHGHAGDT